MKALPTVDIVIPVRNEQACLERSVRTLHAALGEMRGFKARIIIADNGSDDDTAGIGAHLTRILPHVMMLRLDEPGRGRALRAAWSASTADVVAYMDADLSTELAALPHVVHAVASGRADLAIGSRVAPGSRVRRSLRRELISRCYNRLLRALLHVHVRDAQCGFKALRTDVARRLLPSVQDQRWFFDTELLVTAERAGLRVVEVPVCWVEDPSSTVAISRTALEDLRGIARLRRATHPVARRARLPRLAEQVTRFAIIGVVSTAAYVGLFDSLRTVIAAQAANALALLVTAVANTAANRRFTFGQRGRTGRTRMLLSGMLTFALALAVTSASLAGIRAAHPSALAVDAVLIATSCLATILRFRLLRAARVGS